MSPSGSCRCGEDFTECRGEVNFDRVLEGSTCVPNLVDCLGCRLEREAMLSENLCADIHPLPQNAEKEMLRPNSWLPHLTRTFGRECERLLRARGKWTLQFGGLIGSS